MRRWLKICFLCLLAAAGVGRGAWAKVTDVHIEKSSNNVVLFIRGNETLQYKLSEFQDPPRMMVTVFDQALAVNRPSIKVNQGQVQEVFLQQDGEHVRFNIVLSARSQYNVFTKDGNRTIVLSMRTDDFALDGTPAKGEGAFAQTGAPVAGQGMGAGQTPKGGVGPNFPPQGFAYRDYQGDQPPPLPGYGFGQLNQAGKGGAFDTVNVFEKGVDTSPLLEHVVFHDATISEVSLQLSKMTGVNILVEASIVAASEVDAAVGAVVREGAGGITLDLHNVTLEQALDSIAKTSGWTWMKLGNSYLIVTLDTKFQGFAQSGWGNALVDTVLPSDVRFVALQYASAYDVASYVRPILGEDNDSQDFVGIAVDGARNALILRGPAHILDRAQNIIAKLDVPSFNKPLVSRVLYLPDDLWEHPADIQNLEDLLKRSAFMGVDGEKPLMKPMTNEEDLLYDITFIDTIGAVVYIGPEEGFLKLKSIVDQFAGSGYAWRMHTFKLQNLPVMSLPRGELSSVFRWGLASPESERVAPNEQRGQQVYYDINNNSIQFFGSDSDAKRLKEFLDRVDTVEAKVVTVAVPLKNLKTHIIAPSTVNASGGRASGGSTGTQFSFFGDASATATTQGDTASCQHALECQLRGPYYGYPYYGEQPELQSDDGTEPVEKYSRNPVVISFYHQNNTVKITGPQLYVHRIRDLFMEADAEVSINIVTDTLRMKYAAPIDAGNYLQAVMSRGGGCSRGGSANSSFFTGAPVERGMDNYSEFIFVGGIQLVPGSELDRTQEDSVCLYWTSDDHRGLLVLEGPPTAVAQAKRHLANYDQPVAMVKLDMKVLELRSLDSERNVAEILYNNGDFSATAAPNSLILKLIKGVTGTEGSTTGSSAKSARLEFENTGLKARLLGNPSVITTHQKTTSLNFQESVLSSTTDENGNVITEAQPFGFQFTITPFIHDGNEVTLQVRPTITTLQGVEQGPQCPRQITTGGQSTGSTTCVDAPVALTSTRTLDTTVRVKNNVPLILGGIVSSRDRDQDFKVPVLGDLPIIGKLFKGTSKEKDDLEVVIVITPTIMMGNEDLADANLNAGP